MMDEDGEYITLPHMDIKDENKTDEHNHDRK